VFDDITSSVSLTLQEGNRMEIPGAVNALIENSTRLVHGYSRGRILLLSRTQKPGTTNRSQQYT